MADVGWDPGRVVAGAAELGVILRPDQARALLDFGDLLLRWNRAFNLVSRQDTSRLVPRHLLDSLSVAPWLTGSRVLDVGTGAGLPGVPLAIAREDAQFTLIDTSERRIRFIRQALRCLGLANVTPGRADVRELPPEHVFDTVVCRAVAAPASVWSLAAPRLASGGRMVIMSRAGDRGAPAPDVGPADLPPDARLEAVRQVQVPGLPHPHELMLLRHAEAAGSAS